MHCQYSYLPATNDFISTCFFLNETKVESTCLNLDSPVLLIAYLHPTKMQDSSPDIQRSKGSALGNHSKKTSPPSALEAAMSVMQHGTFFETP